MMLLMWMCGVTKKDRDKERSIIGKEDRGYIYMAGVVWTSEEEGNYTC